MSREIKFRAFDGNRMQYCAKGGYNDFIIEGGEVSLFGEFDLRDRKTPDWELMQYTGLKDKNGVEIYEGDIVEVNNNCDTKIISKITFGSLGACYKHNDRLTRLDIFYHDNRIQTTVEVIGNIYESPELVNTLNQEE